MLALGRLTRPPWLLIGSLCFVWIIVIHQLGAQWSVYEQYHYGWGVPLLILYLARERWNDRPPTNTHNRAGPATLLLVFGFLFWVTRILHEASPVWRLTSWALGIEAVTLTLALIWLLAGSNWVRHFGLAFAFFLVAIPWPTPLEIAVVQNLTRINTTIVLNALEWWGTPAVQRGNLIELSTGIVGVEEACSGINSFQTAIMLSCFLGELWSFNWKRRILLIVISFGTAFIGNLFRTFTLVQICAVGGSSSLHRWHDSIGISTLLITFALVLLASFILRKRGVRSKEPVDYSQPHLASVRVQWQYAFFVWICLIELSCEFWYRAHESQPRQQLTWSVAPPTSAQPNDPAVMARAERELKFDTGRSIRWKESDGGNWQIYDFEWYPSRNLSTRVKVQLSQSHRPEICLSAVGMTLNRSLGIHPRQTRALPLPFHDFEFNFDGQRVFVYFCVWDQNSARGLAANFREDTRQRIRAALEGSRNYGQRLLEIAVWGYPSKEQADQALEAKLGEIIIFHRG